MAMHNVSLHRALKHLQEGGLHRALGIKEGEKIPAARLEEAKNSKNPHVAHMAHFASTMAGWHHKGPEHKGTMKGESKGSFAEGGTVPETGNYTLHKGEEVTAKPTGSDMPEKTAPKYEDFKPSDMVRKSAQDVKDMMESKASTRDKGARSGM